MIRQFNYLFVFFSIHSLACSESLTENEYQFNLLYPIGSDCQTYLICPKSLVHNELRRAGPAPLVVSPYHIRVYEKKPLQRWRGS